MVIRKARSKQTWLTTRTSGYPLEGSLVFKFGNAEEARSQSGHNLAELPVGPQQLRVNTRIKRNS